MVVVKVKDGLSGAASLGAIPRINFSVAITLLSTTPVPRAWLVGNGCCGSLCDAGIAVSTAGIVRYPDRLDIRR